MIYDKLSNIQRYRGLHPSLDIAKPMGGHLDGCRIGFDAGGSDRKVSAVIDGETVFSEESCKQKSIAEMKKVPQNLRS